MSATIENERRKHIRRKVLLAGRVAIHGDQMLPCVIKDLTHDGARLLINSSTLLPDRFRFEIPSKHCALRARVIWQTEDMVGVFFDGFDHGSLDGLSGEGSSAAH